MTPKQPTIEFRRVLNHLMGLDYLLPVPNAIHQILLSGKESTLSFTLIAPRDLLFLEKEYAELVINHSEVPFVFSKVRMQSEVTLPGPVPKGTVLTISLERSPRT